MTVAKWIQKEVDQVHKKEAKIKELQAQNKASQLKIKTYAQKQGLQVDRHQQVWLEGDPVLSLKVPSKMTSEAFVEVLQVVLDLAAEAEEASDGTAS
ncbi:hypothetical protein HB847_15715 [Listeria booriae]|uniref:Uncharacterized protein n=1 Tax=Listeria booriae TaxID=1552123 RepID=A0A841YA75_9LIST|nr:hypothetical protein [Listeria booriae]MBC1373799.1 hypothetical protein [Listeria booriae]